jgi:hypothetical protein
MERPFVLKTASLKTSTVIILAVMAVGCSTPQNLDDPARLGRLVNEILTVDTMDAENTLRARCMAENGFEFDIPSSALTPGITVDPVAEFGDAEAAVKVVGTGLIFGTLDAITNPPEFVDYPSEDYERVFLEQASIDGQTIQGGCQMWAQEEAAKDPDFQIAAELESIFAETTQTDISQHPSVVAGWTEWADCMARQGYPDLAERSDMQEIVRGWKAEALEGLGTPEEQATALEALMPADIEIALADVTCSEETQVDDISAALSSEAQAAFLAQHRDLIIDLAERKGLVD